MTPAEQRALAVRVDQGSAVAPSRRTVAQAVDEFLAAIEQSPKYAPRTVEAHRFRLKTRVVPQLGRIPLQKLTTDDVARCIAAWRKTDNNSGWTMMGSLGSLNRMLRFAVRRKWITENPVANLEPEERPSIEEKDKRVLDVSEIRRLIDAASPASRALIATLALTGLRQSEALGLQWGDVDFEDGLIRVRYQLGRGASPQRLKLKTAAARRDVVMLPALVDLLRKHREHAFARGQHTSEHYVFVTASGKPWQHRNATRALYSAAEKAGLSAEGKREVSTHTLRHGFVSILITELGFDPVRVAEQVGHSRPSFTLDVYTHLFRQANHAEAIRARMEASSFGRVLDDGEL